MNLKIKIYLKYNTNYFSEKRITSSLHVCLKTNKLCHDLSTHQIIKIHKKKSMTWILIQFVSVFLGGRGSDTCKDKMHSSFQQNANEL
jgi:hypothetical protein